MKCSLFICNMKLVFSFLFLFAMFSFTACKHKKNIPDVSNISVNLELKRFDVDFFKSDSNNIAAALDSLSVTYPMFLKDYLYNIQAFPPNQDSVLKYSRLFLTDKLYRAIKDTTLIVFDNKSLESIKADIEKSFKYVKYYFPNYTAPSTIYTFVGPLEGTGNAITYQRTTKGLAIGLQSYLGAGFSVYQNQYISQVYPFYKSRRFSKEYIVVNSVQNVIEDLYPARVSGKNLIQQMIELGKKMYLTDLFLPEVADSLKIGYTGRQLEGCFKNEKNIWGFFVENNLLFEKEPNTIATYLNDGPATPEISPESPGFIGQFVGWQIVKCWMEKHPKATVIDLLQTPEAKIFDEAKYKP